MLRIIPVLLLLIGCVEHTNVIMFNEGSQFPPTTKVDILSQPPSVEYVEIATIEAKGTNAATWPDLMESIRKKAKEIGADAIIPTKDQTQINIGTAVRATAIKYKQ